MSDIGKLFIQLMEKAPPHVQLATECLLYIGAAGKSTEEQAGYIRVLQLDAHTKGEYKRAIKHLRECQSLDGGRHRAFYEETIAFIRRELMSREVLA